MTVPVDFEVHCYPPGCAPVDPLSRAEKLLGRINDGEPVGAVLSLLLECVRQHERTLRECYVEPLPTELETQIGKLAARVAELERPQEPRPSVEGGGWEYLRDEIRSDCRRHGWSDQDGALAWRMGRKAMLEARSYGARWPHDPEDAS